MAARISREGTSGRSTPIAARIGSASADTSSRLANTAWWPLRIARTSAIVTASRVERKSTTGTIGTLPIGAVAPDAPGPVEPKLAIGPEPDGPPGRSDA